LIRLFISRLDKSASKVRHQLLPKAILDANRNTMKSILFLTLLIAQIAYSRDDRLGIDTHFSQNWDLNTVMPLVVQSDFGWIKDDIYWSEFEKTKGVYQVPRKVQNWINLANQYGLKICACIPYGNELYADPYDPTAYSRFAAWLAQKFAGKIQAIEVCNEPNDNFKSKETDWWHKYVNLLNVSAQAIKAVNPQLTVIGLGANPNENYGMMAIGISPLVDGLTDHPYGWGILGLMGSQSFPSFVNEWRTHARKYNTTTAMWLTEWGNSTFKLPSGFVVTEQMQAQWEAARLIESHALGVEHSFIYVFKDESDDPHSNYANYGLIHTNLAAKQALGTINRVTRLLDGLKPNSQLPFTYDVPSNFVWQDYRAYRFDAVDGSKALIAFWQASHQGSAVSLKIHQPGAKTVTLCDLLSGNQKPLSFSWDLNDSNTGTVVMRVSVSDTPQLVLIQ
jgi:hypothetical protein